MKWYGCLWPFTRAHQCGRGNDPVERAFALAVPVLLVLVYLVIRGLR